MDAVVLGEVVHAENIDLFVNMSCSITANVMVVRQEQFSGRGNFFANQKSLDEVGLIVLLHSRDARN